MLVGSLKVIENGTTRVFHCNYGPILYCFEDKARHWSRFLHIYPST